jgi:hypothetical protein
MRRQFCRLQVVRATLRDKRENVALTRTFCTFVGRILAEVLFALTSGAAGLWEASKRCSRADSLLCRWFRFLPLPLTQFEIGGRRIVTAGEDKMMHLGCAMQPPRLLLAVSILLASGCIQARAVVSPVQEILSTSPDGRTRIVVRHVADTDDAEHLVLEGIYVEVGSKLTRIDGGVSLMVGMSENRFDWKVHWAPDGSSVAIDACHKHLSRVDVLLRDGNSYRLLDALVKFDLEKEVLAWMKIHHPKIPLSEEGLGKTWIWYGEHTKNGMRLEFSITGGAGCSGTEPGVDGELELRFGASPTVRVSSAKADEEG